MSTSASTNSEQQAGQVVGATSATPEPRNDLNGLLLQLAGEAEVYLVINGFRRLVPNMDTFYNVFVRSAKITPFDISQVSLGPQLSHGTSLVNGESADVYLVSTGVKMLIPSMDIFNRYQFNTSTIKKLPQVVIDAIPNGPNLEGPHN
jgi:hypothetical protein